MKEQSIFSGNSRSNELQKAQKGVLGEPEGEY